MQEPNQQMRPGLGKFREEYGLIGECFPVSPFTFTFTVVAVLTPLDSTSSSLTHRNTLGFRIWLGDSLAGHRGLGLNHHFSFTRATTWPEPYEKCHVFFTASLHEDRKVTCLSTQTVYNGVISQISSQVLPLLSHHSVYALGPKHLRPAGALEIPNPKLQLGWI